MGLVGSYCVITVRRGQDAVPFDVSLERCTPGDVPTLPYYQRVAQELR